MNVTEDMNVIDQNLVDMYEYKINFIVPCNCTVEYILTQVKSKLSTTSKPMDSVVLSKAPHGMPLAKGATIQNLSDVLYLSAIHRLGKCMVV